MTPNRRFLPALAALALAACASGPTSTTPHPAPGEPDLAEVRRLTERFRDVNVALAQGYVRDPGDLCDTAAMMGQPAERGAMGIHFFRPDLLGLDPAAGPRVNGDGTHTDFRNPSILIYEPQADGSLELVAVENLVFQKSWHATGAKAPPTFHGVVYDTMADDPATAIDEAHMFEPHYDRHVWIYRENPNGVFAPFNPAVSCAHHRGPKSHSHHAEAADAPDPGASPPEPVGVAHGGHDGQGGHAAHMMLHPLGG